MTQQSPTAISRAITTDVFVANASKNVVDTFNFATGMQTGQIGGFESPEGLATDVKGNLYVADTLEHTIKIFAPPYTMDPVILRDTGYYPVSVHVDSKGNIFVTNICSGFGGSCYGEGNTIEFPAGSKIFKTLDGGPGRPFFVTTDAAGDVWVDGQVSLTDKKLDIGYFSNSTGAYERQGIYIDFPGGMTFDKKGNLLLVDQEGAIGNGGSVLDIFPPGSIRFTTQITLQTNGDDILDVALGSVEARLFAADADQSLVNVLTYDGGVFLKTFVASPPGELESVAVIPATLP